MPNSATTAIVSARNEVARILRRYGLSWFDVAPDLDEQIWNRVEPVAREIRKNLFRTRYPRLYEKGRRKKTSSRIS